jgi:2-polyprenyl-3-methyl-5-hydroxy-6-metoxy-1,4-benzoquinol methylase
MKIAQRIIGFTQSALKSYGPSSIKRFLWNREYSGDKWNFADHTIGDCVYSHLERHAAHGSILDLGCGTGNTSTELAANAYSLYVGVDISEACLTKARNRAREAGRADKNHFDCGDFLSYAPAQQFDVILFRESMYHVPMGKIESTLDHYSRYLKDGGVFIVRLAIRSPDGKQKSRPAAMISTIEKGFDVLEDSHYEDSGATVIVFRPKRTADIAKVASHR